MAGRNKEYQMAIRIAGEVEKSLPTAMRHTKSELRAIARDAAVASKAMEGNFRQSLMDTRSGLAGVNKIGSEAFRAVERGAKMAALATSAVAAASVKVGMDFESQMSTVKSISGATGADFEALTEKAEKMGATTSFTATEAGEAMEYMAMAGWKTKDMLAGTEGIMNLAAASGEELGTTSDIVTDALTAFGMQAKDSTHFADVLAKTAASANTNVSMMGESFKYVAPIAGSLKYSVEDVSHVLGLMANSGIKASQAGTSVRSWLTRMAKPTDESEAAMKKLGIRMTDSHGKMLSLAQVTQKTRKAFAGLTEKQKAEYAAMLAGKTGMSGLLAVVNSSEKDYKKLEKAISNCSGAAKEMADIKLDNLKGDITLFTSAMQGAGIKIYDELKEPLRDLVSDATEWVGDFSEGFSKEFPTVMREVRNAGEAIHGFAEPLLNVGEWFLDNPDVLAGSIAGIGTALVSYKVASGVMALAESFMALNPATLAVLGGGAAVAGIVGIGTAMEVSAKQAAEANLDAHFGDVALSMKELDAAARQIVGNGYLTRVDELMDSKGKAADFVESMSDAMSDIQKSNWKIEAGITLKKDEIKDYDRACQSYVENAQEYITQQGYSVSIAAKVLFDDGDDNGITERSNSWYTDLERRAGKLGEKLNKVLNKKLSKSFTISDKEGKVNDLLSEVDEITRLVAEAQDKAKLDLLDAKWTGVDINKDSFKNLQEDINKYTEEATEGAESAFNTTMTSLEGQLADGTYKDKKGKKHKYTQKMFDSDKEKALQAYYNQQAEAVMNGYDFMIGKVQEKYGEELGPAMEAVQKGIADRLPELDGLVGEDYVTKLSSIAEDVFAQAKVEMSDDERYAVQQLMPYINDSVNRLKEIRTQAQISGVSLEDNTQNTTGKAIRDTNIINAATGTKSYMVSGLGMSAVNNIDIWKDIVTQSDEERAKEEAKEAGQRIIDKYAEGISASSDAAVKEAEILHSEVVSKLTDNQTPVTFPIRFTIPGGTPNLIPELGSTSGKGKKIKDHADGGIFTSPHIGRVAEAGYPEALIPIDGSQNAYNLWWQTGELLGITGKANSFSNLARELESTSGKGVNVNAANNQPVNISFSPKIIIQGNGNGEDVRRATTASYAEFEKMMKRYVKNSGRMSFTGG